MITNDRVRDILSSPVIDGVFTYPDGVVAVIVDSVYTFHAPAAAVADAVAATGRPAKQYNRAIPLDALIAAGVIDWEVVAEGYEVRPTGWLDDVFIGVCRSQDDISRIKVSPAKLWRIWASEQAVAGVTAQGITHRAGISERQARRYMDKLMVLDSVIGMVLHRRVTGFTKKV